MLLMAFHQIFLFLDDELDVLGMLLLQLSDTVNALFAIISEVWFFLLDQFVGVGFVLLLLVGLWGDLGLIVFFCVG